MRKPAAIFAPLLVVGACSGGGGVGLPDGPQLTQPDMSGPQSPHYTVDTVDESATGNGTAVIYDGTGAVHAFYFGRGVAMTCNLMGTNSMYHPADLYHAQRGGSGYMRLSVNGISLAEANGVNAAIDPKSGKPAVIFQGGVQGANYCGGSDVMLGRFDGSTWSLSMVADKATSTGKVDRPGGKTGPVDTSGDVVGPWSALAFDSSGALYTAWQDIHFGFAAYDFTQADLEFGYEKGGAFVLGDEVDNLGAGLYNALALTKGGQPLIAYSSYGVAGGVQVAARTNDRQWTYSMLAGGGTVAPSVATAPVSGKVGVAYYDTQLKVLRLAESTDNGAHWGSPDVVNHNGDVGRYASLSYDKNDNPVIGYYKCGDITNGAGCDPATDAVRVARRAAAGDWTSADVDTGGPATCGPFVSLALNAFGKATIVYQCFVFDHNIGDFKPTVKMATEN